MVTYCLIRYKKKNLVKNVNKAKNVVEMSKRWKVTDIRISFKSSLRNYGQLKSMKENKKDIIAFIWRGTENNRLLLGDISDWSNKNIKIHLNTYGYR